VSQDFRPMRGGQYSMNAVIDEPQLFGHGQNQCRFQPSPEPLPLRNVEVIRTP